MGALHLTCVFQSGEGLGGRVASQRQDSSGSRETFWQMARNRGCGPYMALLGLVLGCRAQGPADIASPCTEKNHSLWPLLTLSNYLFKLHFNLLTKSFAVI